MIRASDFVEAGEYALVVGVYWVADADAEEPALYQVVRVRNGRIAGIQDFRRHERALRAARAA